MPVKAGAKSGGHLAWRREMSIAGPAPKLLVFDCLRDLSSGQPGVIDLGKD